MECDTLYYPTTDNHSFCEFFYKDRENGTLVVFQLTRQVSGPKYITQSAFTQFLKSIKFPKDQISEQFKLIFVPGPNQAETMSVVVKIPGDKNLKEIEEERTLDLIDSYTILKIDKHYNLLITQSKQSTTNLKKHKSSKLKYYSPPVI